MAGGHAIRGSRVGAGPMGEAERGDSAPKVGISFYCAHGHVTTPSFLRGANIPKFWDCPKCGCPAGQDEHAPPAPPRIEPYKTHLAYVKERRTESDAEAILNDVLCDLRSGDF